MMYCSLILFFDQWTNVLLAETSVTRVHVHASVTISMWLCACYTFDNYLVSMWQW